LPIETPKFNLGGGFFSKPIIKESYTPIKKSSVNNTSFEHETIQDQDLNISSYSKSYQRRKLLNRSVTKSVTPVKKSNNASFYENVSIYDENYWQKKAD